MPVTPILRPRRFGRGLKAVAIVSAVLIAAAPVSADPFHGKGADLKDRHLQAALMAGAPSPLVLDGFELLAHTNLGGGVPNGDIAVYDHGGQVGKHAYVGTWSAQCTGQGAKIIDVRNPEKPKWLGFVGARSDSSNEDVDVVRIGERDVLGIGVQICGRRGQAGLALYDVTNPVRPVELSFLPAPAGGVHELDLVVRGDRALALLAVPFAEFPDEEGNPGPGGFQIADITDPTNPSIVGEWNGLEQGFEIDGATLDADGNFDGLGSFAASFAHSARAADEGMTAYVSYWDLGIVKLDIGDPANPELVGRTLYDVTADGDGHSMTPYDVGGTRYILQNDEDFDPGPTTATVTTSATGTDEYHALQEPWSGISLTAHGPITDEVHDAGVGCDAADYVGADGRIAFVDTVDPFHGVPPCPIGEQAILAAQAGAVAFVSNLGGPDTAWPFGPDTDPGAVAAATATMPALQVSDESGLATEIRAAVGPVTMTLEPNASSWGYLRVFAETGDPEWTQVGSFVGPASTLAPGSWSIHNTEVLGNRAYVSWYSAGIVALDVSDPMNPQMVGQFVPQTSKRYANSLGTGPAEVWGVAIDSDGIVYASDMRTGLWIVRPTGDAVPGG